MNLFKKYLHIVESNNSLSKNKTFFESNEYKVNFDLDKLIEKPLNEIDLEEATSRLNEIFKNLSDDFKSDDIFSENYFDNFNKKLSDFLKRILDNEESFVESELEEFIEYVSKLYFNLLDELINILETKKDYNSYLFKEINDTYNQKSFDIVKNFQQKPNKYRVTSLLSRINPMVTPKIAMFAMRFGKLYDIIREPFKTEEEEAQDLQYKFDVDDIISRVDKYTQKSITYIFNDIKTISNEISNKIKRIENKDIGLFLKDEEKKEKFIDMIEEIFQDSNNLMDAFDAASLEIELPSEETKKYLEKYERELKINYAPLTKNTLFRFLTYLSDKPMFDDIISQIKNLMEFSKLSEY